MTARDELTQAQNENQEPQEQEQPEQEQEQAPEAETPAPDEEKPEQVEAAEEPAEPAAETPEQTEQAKAEEKHRRAGGWQRKIERLERERQLLIEQLAANRPQQPAAPEQPKDPAAQVEEYVAQRVRQELAVVREQERQQRVQAEFQKRTQEVRAAHPDFDDALESVSDIPVPQHVQRALLTSQHGAAVMYALAKNRPELERISSLPDIEAMLELGRLAAQVAVTPTPKTPTKPAMRPPVPPTSVASSKAATRNLDDLPLSEYKRAYRSGRR